MKVAFKKITPAILLFFCSCSLATASIERTEGVTASGVKHINYTNTADVVTYSSHKASRAFIDELSKKYTGLADDEQMDRLLTEQRYCEVLNHLWTEKDQQRKIQWLESKVKEGHAILMLELGEAYFDQDPSPKTFNEKTQPWILAGSFITRIDSKCTSDESVSAAPEALNSIYINRMIIKAVALGLVGEKDQLLEYRNAHLEEYKASALRIMTTAIEPLSRENSHYPSPEWVFHHGVNSFLGTKNTVSEEEYDSIRKKGALFMLFKLQGKPGST